MYKRFIVLTSHKLTPEQLEILKGFKIIHLPKSLQERFSQVDPQDDLSLYELDYEIKNWLTRLSLGKADTVLIQGEYGLTHSLVNFVNEGFSEAVYATSKRENKEITLEDGGQQKVSVFRHIKFRKYY